MQRTSEQQIPDCVSVGFIAKKCGVSNTTVLRWINAGQLPAFRLPGGHFRIERDGFINFLDEHHIPLETHASDQPPDK